MMFAIAGGLVSGEFCVCIVFSGLWGRHWLAGFAAATGLASIGLFFLLVGQVGYTYWVDHQYVVEAFFPLFFVAPVVFLSSITLLGFRLLGGWRITRQMEAPSGVSMSIADLVVCTTFVAALLTFCRASMGYMEVPVSSYLATIGWIGAVYCFASLVALVPTIWILFRDHNQRVMKLSGLIAIDCFLFGAASLGVNRWVPLGPRLPAGTVFALTMIWLIVAFGYTIVGLKLLRLGGFRLHVRRDADVHKSDRAGAQEVAQVPPVQRCTAAQ